MVVPVKQRRLTLPQSVSQGAAESRGRSDPGSDVPLEEIVPGVRWFWLSHSHTAKHLM